MTNVIISWAEGFHAPQADVEVGWQPGFGPVVAPKRAAGAAGKCPPCSRISRPTSQANASPVQWGSASTPGGSSSAQ